MKTAIAVMLCLIAMIIVAIITVSSNPAHSKPRCNVVGLNPKSHPTLKQGLCDLSRALGQVRVTNTRPHKNCRTRSDRTGKPQSWHKYYRGCRAADIRIKGVSPRRIVRWWLRYTNSKPYLGGAHAYRSGFAHVDTRTYGARTW